MQFPDSLRFHVVAAEAVSPRTGPFSPRPIYVYLPEAAAAHPRKKFPAIYCQDGQNLWDDPHCCFGHGGWYLNRIVDELAADGKIEPVIVVGIPNSDERYRDYTPRRSFLEGRDHPYADFICEVVKPYIERNFPAKQRRSDVALLGSSLGGLVALWLAHQRPEIFGKAICLSGAFQVRDRQRQTFVDYLAGLSHQNLRVYLDSGTVADGVMLTRKVAALYRSRGWQDGVDLVHLEVKGHAHNERYWRDRVWRALVFLFGSGPPDQK